ncbi:sugar-transfer associated ATP-grasp domain-containing protein [Colwellia sp. RSH04]|uniref:sugar-transfer associated ATP-grasp domain-containing protein n=1 Tax=Colwellia sp. RSH04 TaxID=2305464 RepID=UPI000E582273|nr:sugar-transfer associated ATP-grasp domain-containing protein [Colwellia sp. RSH04]RHW76424.1 hypothetical protein D1094_08925 [Colwellia sp. RSH04]
MNKIKEYWFTAQNIAKYKNGMTIAVFFKMLACRLVYGFGPQDYVLFGFYNKPFSEAKTYLKKEELEPIQRQVNKEEHRTLVDNKIEFFLHCRKNNLPTPLVLGVLTKKLAKKYTEDITAIEDIVALKKTVHLHGEGRYLLKPLAGSHGAGIIRFSYRNEKLLDDDGNELTFEQVFNVVAKGASFILQPCLAPNKLLKELMPNGALGTIRLVTINYDGKVFEYLPCVRLPTGKSITDNFSHGKSHNLAGAIDRQSGKLSSPFGITSSSMGQIVRVEQHPESQVKFNEYYFPLWQEVMDVTQKACLAFSDLKTVGWDIALTTEGPCLIEGNWRYDCDILQVTYDKGVKEELPQLLI